ncbi:CLIP-associated protein-like [Triticum dicoccoides]|uniref:CLIP-associated protein-like n=1 Tax=Triticum dicoccoides TaxID=85692 RepID=UPI001891A84A|nr:CLIP-associated protein-like [Triticum dicoccoides]
MASSAAAARLRELAPGPGAGISATEAAALAECCAGLLGCGDAGAACSALDALCAAGGDAMRRHVDELTPLVVGRLGDGDAAVREASRRFLVLLMEMKEMNARSENIETGSSIPDVHRTSCTTTEAESFGTNQVKKSSKQRISTRDMSLLAGEEDITRKSVEPIKVFSEKDLIKEMGKVMSTLQPDNEWLIRITAMQRVEGIVLGGAADYSAFPTLLKQLVAPLITQLLDRRSSVVKQACHLLIFLSKELLRDFEPCAELLIPALLKNVVITVLVIAESADNCIKEMLRNCKVARILPRIIEFAKNDRSAVLRGRCCEYAILMLEYWVDTPELQRSANLYEELIKCCIGDATSEVRSGARACYRIFSRIWPERSHQLFSSFEPSRQKMIIDDDAETHQKQLSPIEGIKLEQPQFVPCIPTVMDKVVMVDSQTSLSSGDLQSALAKISLQHSHMTPQVPAEDSKDGLAIGSSFEDMSTLEEERIPVPDPDERVSGISSSSRDFPSATPFEPTPDILLSEATVIATFQDKAECRPEVEHTTSCKVQAPGDPSEMLSRTPASPEESGNLLNQRPTKSSSNGISGGTLRTQQEERPCVRTPRKSVVPKQSPNNHTPNFRRPLLSKVMTNWFYASTRGDLDGKQLIIGEMANSMDVPSSLTGALSLGLNPKSDWMMRVYAFNFLRQHLQERGPKGIQEVAQNFEKVMRLVSQYLDDPHHKVAHAALSSLAEIVPVFKKPFEHYLDKMLPHVFSRLNDPKESTKQQCLAVLKLAGESYSIDSLLPALLRSLDEQKSPKSKLAILDFAKASFVKCTVNSDIYSGSSFLKPWLGKLTLLFKDRNKKLKEAAVVGLSSVYCHYDPETMLSFIVTLSMEEQKQLTRAIKQLIPMIGSDLEEFLQQRRHKQKVSSFDRFAATDPHPRSYVGRQHKSQEHDTYQSSDVRGDQVFSSAFQYLPSTHLEVFGRRTTKVQSELGSESYGHRAETMGKKFSPARRSKDMMMNGSQSHETSISKMHHQNSHQMSSSILVMLDDPDESTRELALSLLVGILEKQERALENCFETLVVKLLHATKDAALKVVNLAHICLTTVVTQFDPLRCLRAIASQLVSHDEKILIVSINSLSKLVMRLSHDDLMTHLSTFLPAVLDAFENHSPYVRKAILLCLVDTFLKLGPAVAPHLERLGGPQLLQLVVTTSASRLSRAGV